jgi:signal-transduction protein with cAMP-binding, CBS, and nucleotidyltransferase domain
MRELDIGAIPIGEDDRLVGIVTDRDIVCRCIAAGLDPGTATARDVMTEGVVFCVDRQDVKDAARIMARKEVRRLPVIDGKKKRMVGMLSLGDVYGKGSRRSSRQVMHAVSAHHPQDKADEFAGATGKRRRRDTAGLGR